MICELFGLLCILWGACYGTCLLYGALIVYEALYTDKP